MISARSKVTRLRVNAGPDRRAAFDTVRALAKTDLDISLQLVPVATGDLRSTGRVEEDEGAIRASVVFGGTAESGREVGYAPYVENEQPFKEPASLLAVRGYDFRRSVRYRG